MRARYAAKKLFTLKKLEHKCVRFNNNIFLSKVFHSSIIIISKTCVCEPHKINVIFLMGFA